LLLLYFDHDACMQSCLHVGLLDTPAYIDGWPGNKMKL